MTNENKSEQQKKQEMVMKFQLFEQQIQAIQQQLEAVDQAIMDITQLNLGLDDLIGKKGQEILAPLGRGVFVKANLVSEDLIVDIGGKNFVGKSIPDTKKIIEEQIIKLEDIREQLNGEMEKINQELTRVFMESQGHSHEHSHEGPSCNCDCEEGCECSDEECDCESDCEGNNCSFDCKCNHK